MNEERDKFLTEAMGKCWHRIPSYAATLSTRNIFICTVCGTSVSRDSNNNFSTWEGFGKLWEWATKQDWWYNFKIGTHCGLTAEGVYEYYINPDELADTIYAYLKERK